MADEPKQKPNDTENQKIEQEAPGSKPIQKKKRRKRKTSPTKSPVDPAPPEPPGFPIVGIGASAGGLEALEILFSHLPPDTGMAFVVVMHLDPTHDSLLSNVLQKFTPMPVVKIEDGLKIEPDHVYVIPSNHELGLIDDTLHLLQMLPEERFRLTIDIFFRHLAADRGRRAICIVLSGTGSDGTLGLRDIKEQGGLVIVQDPDTALHDGMPRSAVATSLADYILPPAEIPEALVAYVQQTPLLEAMPKLDTAALDGLNKIFLLMRTETGHDFSQYRPNTLLRRINKRMVVHKLEKLDDYINFLHRDSKELANLFNEILIGVTQFFREPDAFDSFQKKVPPALFKDRAGEASVRVWVPGCSTGEEAYSLAILLHAYQQAHAPNVKIEIFATDINEATIEQARRGQYPASIAADIPERYLDRYFVQQNHTYQIKPDIREMLIFAQQNLLKDPPFSNLDVISCRNLLIYLKTEAQRKILSLFQYALRTGGFLFLGPSENIGELSDYFAVADRKWRLFKRTEVRTRPLAEAAFFNAMAFNAESSRFKPGLEYNRRDVTAAALLDHIAAVAILVNDKFDILYTYGPVDLYLKMISGEVRFNILDMARPGLQVEVTIALQHVFHHNEPVRRQGLRVKTNGGEQWVDLTVKPINDAGQRSRLSIVIIEEAAAPAVSSATATVAAGSKSDHDDARLIALKNELETTKQYLQSTIEELQAANEEHRSFTEEIQSANEELQSTNEELTTSQEELQSVNEELVTINAEIQSKNEAFRQANDDLHNLLGGTETATLFLDIELKIKRFTPAATKIINLIESDVDRPLKHTVSNLKYEALIEDARRVLDTLNTINQEVQTQDGRWYNMRILPYRTMNNVIDGLVLTFADITLQKESEAKLQQLNDELRAARDYAQNIVDTLHEGLLILDNHLRIESANRSFYDIFGLEEGELRDKLIYELDGGSWDVPDLHQQLERVLAENQAFEKFEFEHTFNRTSHRRLRLNARQLLQADGQTAKVLLAIEDVTERG